MKAWLIILGIAILVMGIWGLIPAWQISGVADPLWHAILKVAVGLITLGVAFSGGKSD